jgi:hypothetical protein
MLVTEINTFLIILQQTNKKLLLKLLNHFFPTFIRKIH